MQIQVFSVFDVLGTAHLYAEKTLKKSAKHQQIKLLIKADETAILHGDAPKLALALRHLLSNAIKFTQQGAINIEGKINADESITIKISDTGLGIDAAQLDQLSQPFVQAEQGLDRSSAGTGLGLAIVKRLCLKWGGSLAFENNSPQGTVVILNLPNLGG